MSGSLTSSNLVELSSFRRFTFIMSTRFSLMIQGLSYCRSYKNAKLRKPTERRAGVEVVGIYGVEG
jgi:hypothetical protein